MTPANLAVMESLRDREPEKLHWNTLGTQMRALDMVKKHKMTVAAVVTHHLRKARMAWISANSKTKSRQGDIREFLGS